MVDSVPVFPLMRTFGGLIIMIVIGVAGAITGALFPVETRRKLSKHSIQTLHE